MQQQPLIKDRRTDAETMALLHTLSGGGRCAALTRAVENHVIPRLLMAGRQDTEAGAVRPTRSEVARLVTLVLTEGQDEVTAHVMAMRRAGVATESLLLDLLAPAARELGAMWEDDTCSFADVSIGLVRLGHVMRLLGRAFAGGYGVRPPGPRALLAQLPGEQHGFGLAMVVQFFRRAGWDVRQEPASSSAGLVDAVQRERFDIVGLSVSSSDGIEQAADLIGALRQHARNRRIGIMVGGPPFTAQPHLAAMIGADATASDGRQAVRRAQALVGRFTATATDQGRGAPHGGGSPAPHPDNDTSEAVREGGNG